MRSAWKIYDSTGASSRCRPKPAVSSEGRVLLSVSTSSHVDRSEQKITLHLIEQGTGLLFSGSLFDNKPTQALTAGWCTVSPSPARPDLTQSVHRHRGAWRTNYPHFISEFSETCRRASCRGNGCFLHSDTRILNVYTFDARAFGVMTSTC